MHVYYIKSQWPSRFQPLELKHILYLCYHCQEQWIHDQISSYNMEYLFILITIYRNYIITGMHGNDKK